jgi:hypothetical protein
MDGRSIGSGGPRPVARRLRALYEDVVAAEGIPIDG